MLWFLKYMLIYIIKAIMTSWSFSLTKCIKQILNHQNLLHMEEKIKKTEPYLEKSKYLSKLLIILASISVSFSEVIINI